MKDEWERNLNIFKYILLVALMSKKILQMFIKKPQEDYP